MKDGNESKGCTNRSLSEEFKTSRVESRRKLLKKIGVAAPVVVTLASRPAYGAGFCSLSGFASMNASGVERHSEQLCGLSQGGWKTPDNGAGVWPSGLIPNPPSQRMHYSGGPNSFLANYLSDPELFLATREAYGTTSFSVAFPDGLYGNYDPRPAGWPAEIPYSLFDALMYGDEISREAAAALLNAVKGSYTNEFPFNNWHFTVEQVRTLFLTLQWPIEGIAFPSLTAVAKFFQAPQV